MYAFSHCENKRKELLSNHYRILRGSDGCHGAQEEHLIDEKHLAGKVAGHTAADHSEYHMTGCNLRCRGWVDTAAELHRVEEDIAGVDRPEEEDTAVAVREAEGTVGVGVGVVAAQKVEDIAAAAVPEEGGIAVAVDPAAGMADGHPALCRRNCVDVVLREGLHSLAGVVLVELHSWVDVHHAVHHAVHQAREHRSPADEKVSHKWAAAVYSRYLHAVLSAGRAIHRKDWEADYASRIGYRRMTAVHKFGHQVVLQEEVEGTSCYCLKEDSDGSPCAMSRTLPRGWIHE